MKNKVLMVNGANRGNSAKYLTRKFEQLPKSKNSVECCQAFITHALSFEKYDFFFFVVD